MSLIKNLFRSFVPKELSQSAAAEEAPAALSPKDYAKSEPYRVIHFKGSDVIFCTPNPGTAWRVDTLFTKEPDTIEWIGGFRPREVFLDIGANVGMYTIWAAKTRGVTVYAFEPESQNYALLNKNIMLNKLDGKAFAYSAALSDRPAFSLLYLSQFGTGGSCHSFDEQVDHQLVSRNPVFSQGCYAITLDQLIADGAMPVPQHIKIDVDGFEHKVLSGGSETLKHPNVKSVLVEINNNLEIHRKIVNDMKVLGFTFDSKQVEASIRQEGPFKGVGNYVFCR